MSQLQVIGREAVDDTNSQRDQQAKMAQLYQEAWHNNALIKNQSELLKIQAKQAATEQEKADLTRKSAYFTAFEKVQAKAIDDNTVKNPDGSFSVDEKGYQRDMLSGFDQVHQLFGDEAVSAFGDFSKRHAPAVPAENQYKLSQAQNQMAEAGSHRAQEAYLNAFTQGRLPGMEGSSNTTKGNVVTGVDYSPSGPTVHTTNLDASSAVQTQKEEISNMAAMKKDMAPAKAVIDMLEQKYNDAFFDAPSAAQGVAGTLQYGLEKTGESWSRTNPQVRSYLATKEAFLSRVVRGLGERGVLTDTDIKRVAKSLSTQWTSKEEAKLNFDAIKGIIENGYKEYAQYGQAVGESRPGKPQDSTSGTGSAQGDFLGIGWKGRK